MTINKKIVDETLVVELEGRLDTNTAPQLETELNNSYEGISRLIIDMKELAYISSAGLRVLLSAQKIMNKQGEMIVRNVNDVIAEIFEVTGFVDILNIQ